MLVVIILNEKFFNKSLRFHMAIWTGGNRLNER